MCAALHGAKVVITYLLEVQGMNSLLEVDEVYTSVLCHIIRCLHVLLSPNML